MPYETFGNGSPIDFIEWLVAKQRRKPRRIVRIASRTSGWQTLEGLEHKPIWLQAEESRDAAMQAFTPIAPTLKRSNMKLRRWRSG